MARGARRPRNRFAALAQPLNLIAIQLSGRSNLENLTQGTLVSSYKPIREDLHRLAYATYLLELFDKSSEGATETGELFVMLLTVLELVSYSNALDLVRRATEMKLMASLGFRPQLLYCIYCQETLDNKNPLGYNVSEGGFVCPKCHSHSLSSNSKAIVCSGAGRQLLHDLQVVNLAKLDVLSPSFARTKKDCLIQVDVILHESIRAHLGSLPKAADFLESIGQGSTLF